jgi:hypothetical protein
MLFTAKAKNYNVSVNFELIVVIKDLFNVVV